MHSAKFPTLALAAAAAVGFTAAAQAEQIFGLTTQNSLVVIDSETPTVSLDGGFVTGLEANETLVGIDYRAGTGELFAVGSGNNLYTIDQDSFEADLVGSFSPRLRGTSFAFDFNPAFDGGSGDPDDVGRFARIISDTDNNRVLDSETGQYLGSTDKTPVFYADGDVNEGRDPNVIGIAYNNNVPGAESTQQFGIDRNTGDLVTVANNAGTLNTVGDLGVMGFTNEGGFDISGPTGTAFAALQRGPNSELFVVDTDTGTATSLGIFASGDIIRDLTVVPVPEPASLAFLGLAAAGLIRRR